MAKVSVVAGASRKANILRAIKLMESDISKAVKEKNSDVLFVKVNGIDSNFPLACTAPSALEVVLEHFHKKFGKIIVGDNSFTFYKENNIYSHLKEKFENIRFSNLTEFPYEKIRLETIYGDKEADVSLLPKKAFTVSLALPKTHDFFVFTACSKNMIGCVISERGSVHALKFGDRPFLNRLAKSIIQSRENLANVIGSVKPDVSVLDGFYGMDRDGPVLGRKINLGIALCGLDSIAVDSLAAKICGFNYVPYLDICGKKGIGTTNLEKIKILKEGFERLEEISKKFKPHYLYKYQIASEPKMSFPFVDIKFCLHCLKRSYRIIDKLRGKP